MRLPDGGAGGTRLPTESPHPNWPGGAAYRGLRHVTLRHHPHPFTPEGPFGWKPVALAILHPPRGSDILTYLRSVWGPHPLILLGCSLNENGFCHTKLYSHTSHHNSAQTIHFLDSNKRIPVALPFISWTPTICFLSHNH